MTLGEGCEEAIPLPVVRPDEPEGLLFRFLR